MNLKAENAVMENAVTVGCDKLTPWTFLENVDDNILTFEQKNSQAISSRAAAPASAFEGEVNTKI